MDVIRSKKNILTSIIYKTVLLGLGILTTRFLILYTGNEINGLNSLFKSIVGFLNIAELGVGTAISYSMYKPIVEGNDATVSALYKLFKKVYLIISMIIFIGGLLILPLLPVLVKGYTADINIYFTYILMLISVVISYFYSAKTSLVNAYKDNYVTTTIYSVGMIFQQVLQIVVLILFKSFELYLVCRTIAMLFQWLLTELYVKKKYIHIIKNKESEISSELKKDIVRNSKAMFMHKIGGALVNSAGNIMISAFCGVIVLGKYSNYVSIMTSMIGVLILFFIPLTSIIGHVFAESGGNILQRYYGFFCGFNYILGVIFFLGYYSVIDDLISVFYGNNLDIDNFIVALITINFFLQFFRQATLLFRDSTGTFYYDRWKPIIEGTVNILLAFLLVSVLPEHLRLMGVLISSIVSNLFVCHIIEPYVLYKHVFKTSIKSYYIRNYTLILIFIMLLGVCRMFRIDLANPWLNILINGSISVVVSLLSIPLIVCINKDFAYYFKRLTKKALQRICCIVKRGNC